MDDLYGGHVPAVRPQPRRPTPAPAPGNLLTTPNRTAVWVLAEVGRLRVDAVGGLYVRTYHRGWQRAAGWMYEAARPLAAQGALNLPRITAAELAEVEWRTPDPAGSCRRLGTCPKDGPHNDGCPGG